jgi:hypothetical protein
MRNLVNVEIKEDGSQFKLSFYFDDYLVVGIAFEKDQSQNKVAERINFLGKTLSEVMI